MGNLPAIRQVVVYHEAQSAPTPQPTTWEWNGITWTARVTATPPTQPAGAAMAFDAARGRIVRWGADISDRGYEYDGSTWTQLQLPVRGAVALAYDAVARRVLAFGGQDGLLGFPWTVAATEWLGNVVPPRITVVGSGCVGSAGVPRLISALPSLGDASFRFEVVDAAAQTPCVLGISAAPATVPLGGGCTLLLANPVTLTIGVTSPLGLAAFPVAIPMTPALRGQSAWCQAAVFDPAGSYGGLAFTAASELVVGG